MLALPAELRAALLRTNGVASADARRVGSTPEIVPAEDLPALQEDLARAVREHLAEAEGHERVDEPDLDIRSLGHLFAIGKSCGGDFFVLSEVARTPSGTAPVLRFVHDEMLTCRAERTSIAAFVAALGLEAWNEEACDARATTLLERKTKIVLAAPTAAKAAR